MNVFHGPVEISGQVYNYAKAIRQCGHDATAAVFHPHQYGYPYDELIYPNGHPGRWRGRLRRMRYTATALRRFDVFNYWFGRTILGGLDLRAATALGKPVVMTFCGSEIRSVGNAAAQSPYLDADSWPRTGPDEEYLERLNEAIDVAIVRYYELEPYVEQYFDRVEYVPRAVDCDRIQPSDSEETTDTIRIAHAPSNREMKGTATIEAAVEALQADGLNVELAVIEGTHDDVIAELQRAALVVDQLKLGTFGNLALEGMATATPVVCFLRDDIAERYPDSLPIVTATPETVTDVLRDLAADPERRHTLGLDGRDYVTSHHDLRTVGERLLELYRSL
ncbi:glycosyltransferase family 4 protein [Halopiger djelfimassiliensis]|uniref:glycosyltransferase family 4 protein n=1 Tax=Halopiger djelfimassiliensis TaxID=1293047 RepID=UPI0006775D58|nr:glycosyltransferase family 4 protein [Halopiger djelfimassiliensis]